MTYASLILAAALKAKVSGTLLLAICTVETNLTNVVVYHDGKSPSYGICQIKLGTAKMMGFKGKAEELVNPMVNAKFAAKYLKYQQNRYNVNDNVNDKNLYKAIAAYNAGSYIERTKGVPVNLRYLTKVRVRLKENLQSKTSCDKVE